MDEILNDKIVFEIHAALESLASTADNGHIEAIRTLLSAHEEHDFVQLEEITRYALLARLAEQSKLATEERKLKRRLAARLPEEARSYADRSYDWSTSMRRFGSCGDDVK